MTTRRSAWGLGTFDPISRRRESAQRALERAQKRRKAADLKRSKKDAIRRRRERRRQESKWRKDAMRRRRADDKRVKAERKRWQRQQKQQTLGGGFGSRGRGAAGMRAAHNLITLANSIGVRFTRDDTAQLIAYADQELAQSGGDIYTIYQSLTQMTFIGRRVRGVVAQYDVGDDEGRTDGVNDRILGRVVQAGEMLGDWERTKSVEQSVALGLAITQSLGVSPDAIKADQQGLEAEVSTAAYDELVTMYQGKSRLWTAVHLLLHPEDRLEAVSERAVAQLEEDTRAADASEARVREAVAGTGESVSVQSGDFVGWLRMKLGF